MRLIVLGKYHNKQSTEGIQSNMVLLLAIGEYGYGTTIMTQHIDYLHIMNLTNSSICHG